MKFFRCNLTFFSVFGDRHELKHGTVNGIQDRIARITNTPAKHQEHFQILHYSPGEFYKGHHDYIPEQSTMPCGARLATFFLYLNDVEKGGGTDFPKVGITAMPKKGRAILWYNVRYVPGQGPHGAGGTWEQIHETLHEAMPVRTSRVAKQAHVYPSPR